MGDKTNIQFWYAEYSAMFITYSVWPSRVYLDEITNVAWYLSANVLIWF